MLAPRPLDVSPALAAIPDEEAVCAVAVVVTREGRVSNYELLQGASRWRTLKRVRVRRSNRSARRGKASAVRARPDRTASWRSTWCGSWPEQPSRRRQRRTIRMVVPLASVAVGRGRCFARLGRNHKSQSKIQACLRSQSSPARNTRTRVSDGLCSATIGHARSAVSRRRPGAQGADNHLGYGCGGASSVTGTRFRRTGRLGIAGGNWRRADESDCARSTAPRWMRSGKWHPAWPAEHGAHR